MVKLNGCAAVITGASSGLGAEFARALTGRAARLLLVARRRETLEEVKAALESAGTATRVFVCAADLGTKEGQNALVSWVKERDFKPDVLINNAGVGDYGAFKSADGGKQRRLSLS